MIYINGRFLTQKITGVARFAFELCKVFQEMDVEYTLLIPKNQKIEIENNFTCLSIGKYQSHLWEQVDLPKYLKSVGKPLLINFSGLGPLFYDNQIITIHDLSFYVEPKWFSFSYRLFYGCLTPIVAKKSKAIITVSNFSKSEIQKFLKVPSEKITVVYNSISQNLKNNHDSIQATSDTAKKYILAVSSLDPRKNHQKLIEAFESDLFDNYYLYLVGKGASHFNINLKENNNERLKFLGYVSDNELMELYSGAEVFIYPSLYEGFGVPPLEAMINKCPIIVSNIAPLREVCQDAAYYIDPNDVRSIINGLNEVINNTELRIRLSKSGFARANEFSWTTSGTKVIELIKKISHESSSND